MIVSLQCPAVCIVCWVWGRVTESVTDNANNRTTCSLPLSLELNFVVIDDCSLSAFLHREQSSKNKECHPGPCLSIPPHIHKTWSQIVGNPRGNCILWDTVFCGAGDDDGFMVVIVDYRTNLISIQHNLITRACATHSDWWLGPNVASWLAEPWPPVTVSSD